MSLLPAEQPRFEEMNKVVELYIQNVNPTKIAKELGIRRVDVLNHIEDWRNTAKGSEVMKDRVEELIAMLDEHFSMLIRKAYEVIEEVDRIHEDGEDTKRKETMTRSQMLSQKMSAIKTIADLESKRIDVLQKSGLLEMDHLGDEIAKMEEEKQIILDILTNDLCDHCKPTVMAKIASLLSGQPVETTYEVVKGDVT